MKQMYSIINYKVCNTVCAKVCKPDANIWSSFHVLSGIFESSIIKRVRQCLVVE